MIKMLNFATMYVLLRRCRYWFHQKVAIASQRLHVPQPSHWLGLTPRPPSRSLEALFERVFSWHRSLQSQRTTAALKNQVWALFRGEKLLFRSWKMICIKCSLSINPRLFGFSDTVFWLRTASAPLHGSPSRSHRVALMAHRAPVYQSPIQSWTSTMENHEENASTKGKNFLLDHIIYIIYNRSARKSIDQNANNTHDYLYPVASHSKKDRLGRVPKSLVLRLLWMEGPCWAASGPIKSFKIHLNGEKTCNTLSVGCQIRNVFFK